jgi:hypothetical protein
MKLNQKFSPLFLFIFLILIYSSKESVVSNLRTKLRSLWDETIKVDTSRLDSSELESIEHCRHSDYKYFIFYVSGQNYTFNQFVNRDNAVRKSNLFYIIYSDLS